MTTKENVAEAIGAAARQSKGIKGPVCDGWLYGIMTAVWSAAKAVDVALDRDS